MSSSGSPPLVLLLGASWLMLAVLLLCCAGTLEKQLYVARTAAAVAWPLAASIALSLRVLAGLVGWRGVLLLLLLWMMHAAQGVGVVVETGGTVADQVCFVCRGRRSTPAACFLVVVVQLVNMDSASNACPTCCNATGVPVDFKMAKKMKRQLSLWGGFERLNFGHKHPPTLSL